MILAASIAVVDNHINKYLQLCVMRTTNTQMAYIEVSATLLKAYITLFWKQKGSSVFCHQDPISPCY